MDELVMRVGFPMRRFASACNHDAGPVFRHSRSYLDSGGQVHRQADLSQNSLRMIDEADQLPKIVFPRRSRRLEAADDGALKLAYLNEEDAARKWSTTS